MDRLFHVPFRTFLGRSNYWMPKRLLSSAADDLMMNPFYQKYETKIASLQKTSPEVFVTRLSDGKMRPSKNTETERSFSKVGIQRPNLTQSFAAQKSLDTVMKIDHIKEETPEAITEIWKKYHQSQDKICAVIPEVTYNKIQQRTKAFPIFLFPIPKSEGYEFIVAVWENHSCHFTSLINFQAYKEDAPECLTIIHYPELIKEKGIVLMHGTYDKNTLNATEAQFLGNQLQLYYTAAEDSSKYHLLDMFTQKPEIFKHMDLISELETTTIGII